MRKTKIEDVIAIVESNNFTLLSDEYRSSDQKLELQCNNCSEYSKRTLATIKRNGLKCKVCSERIPWNKGKKGVSAETSAKMSAAKLGRIPHNKGKSMSEKQRKKISCSVRGIDESEFDGFFDRKQHALDYSNRRYKEDPQYKIAKLIRNKLYKTINGKSSTTLSNLVGCSISDLRKHIASKFVDDMSWENHGLWHIDHIVPLSSFDLTDKKQLKKAWHYSNLHPLWASDNLAKLDHNTKANKLYIIAGAFGAGKSYVAMNSGYEYIQKDKDRDYFKTLVSKISKSSVVLEISVGISSFIERYGHLFDYEILVIRGSNNRNVGSFDMRDSRMSELEIFSDFSGTAEEVLAYLKEKPSTH